MIRTMFAMTMAFRWWIVAAIVVLWCMAIARADQADDIRAALNANFEAYNREDLKEMMDTLSPTLPNREEFEQQARRVFETTDTYIRVEDFELLEVKGQFAKARVIQGTLTSDERIPESDAEDFYRDNSALLPDVEQVEYIQAFKREGNRWRLWLIVSEPRKPFVGYTDDGVYHGPNAAEVNKKKRLAKGGTSDCPNGNCGFPRVRVSAR